MTVTEVELPVAVTIPQAEIERGLFGLPRAEISRGLLGQGYAVFAIEVTAFGLVRQVRRPFEDFEKLHAEMTQFIRGLPSEVRLKLNYALPALPTAPWYWNDSAKALEERRAKLEAMLQKLLQQPEIVHDSEGRLWQFLQLHPAASAAASLLAARSCGPWLRTLWEVSAEGDGLLPLRHPSVEEALLDAIADTLRDGRELSSVERQSGMAFAGELLERIFAGGKEVVARPEPVLRRRVEALVSLALCTCLPPPSASGVQGKDEGDTPAGQSVPLRTAAGSALLQLARADRASWQQALHAYLSAETAQGLVALVGADSQWSGGGPDSSAEQGPSTGTLVHGSSERLVAELLLRGFDGALVQRFMEEELASERKQLLNLLFASHDLFVRLIVGLLLSRLLCEPGYTDVAKAEAGLGSLCREVAPQAPHFLQAGLGPILLEERCWLWLSNLVASAHPTVSGFALLVVVHAVQPSPACLLQTPGMHRSLVAMLEPDVDPTVRRLAARTLFATYHAEEGAIPTDAAVLSGICSALAASTEEAVARQSEEHSSSKAGMTQARERCSAVASTEVLLSTVCEGTAALLTEAEAWRSALSGASDTTGAAEEANVACIAALGSHRGHQSTAACTLQEAMEFENGSVGDLFPELQLAEEELASEEAKVEEATQLLEQKVQEKMSATLEVSECNEAVHRWLTAAAEAEARETEATTTADRATELEAPQPQAAEEKAPECWRRHREAVERLKALRGRVEELDSHLQELSEALPAKRQAAEARRHHARDLAARAHAAQQRHAAVLLDWHRVLEASRTCDTELGSFADRLVEVRGAFAAECTQRHGLRGAIRGLVASLTALDDHLGSLEATDNQPVAAA